MSHSTSTRQQSGKGLFQTNELNDPLATESSVLKITSNLKSWVRPERMMAPPEDPKPPVGKLSHPAGSNLVSSELWQLLQEALVFMFTKYAQDRSLPNSQL